MIFQKKKRSNTNMNQRDKTLILKIILTRIMNNNYIKFKNKGIFDKLIEALLTQDILDMEQAFFWKSQILDPIGSSKTDQFKIQIYIYYLIEDHKIINNGKQLYKSKRP